MPDFCATLRGLLEKATHDDTVGRFVADAMITRTLRNHTEAILRVVEAAKHVTDASLMGDLGMADLQAMREALAALDKE